MSTIEARFENKIEDFKNASNNISKIDEQIDNLIKKKLNENDIGKCLHYDAEIYNLECKRKEIDEYSLNNYLLKVSTIIDSYNNLDVNSNEENKGELLNFFNVKSNNNKGQIYSKYMHEVENSPPQPTKFEFDYICKNCKVVKRISLVESLIICPQCGEDEIYHDNGSQGLTYEQEINTDTNIHFAYKRINHFRELLCQLQAKESSNIPNEIIDCLRYEFKKERITNVADITHAKVKLFLKKLKYNKYYENSYQITNILTGQPPPSISNELYEKFICMFMQIQEPFEKACPSSRKNFLSYNYVLYKFCELLNELELINYFSLLKSREKLYQQDCIWKGICEIIGWKFIKSV